MDFALKMMNFADNDAGWFPAEPAINVRNVRNGTGPCRWRRELDLTANDRVGYDGHACEAAADNPSQICAELVARAAWWRAILRSAGDDVIVTMLGAAFYCGSQSCCDML